MKKKVATKNKSVAYEASHSLQEALKNLSESTKLLQKKKLKSSEYQDKFVIQASGSSDASN